MLVETLADATLVPSAAIQRGAPGTFVYVVKDDQTVTVTPVKLGPVQGETTAIASGVAPGAMVVVDGTDKLREGGEGRADHARCAGRAGRDTARRSVDRAATGRRAAARRGGARRPKAEGGGG